MKTNTQLLAIAKKQLGNNGSKYRHYVGQGGSWCDMFVYWLYAANDNGSLLPWKGNQRYYCPASIKWCEKNLAQVPLYLAMPCDPIYFDWDGNGIPNHIGIVESKKSTGEICTIEGNTSGGIVDDKTRTSGYTLAVFRPHFVPTGLKKERLAVDGDFGYKSIYVLQLALGVKADGILGKATVKKLQAACKVSQDGAWGAKTSRAVQKMIGLKGKDIDGAFGKKSVMALQKWANAKVFTAAPKKPAAKPAPKKTETKPEPKKETVTKPAEPKPKETKKPKASLKSYRIEVDLTNQVATVYGVYSDKSSKALMSEFVSTARKGKTTPVGTFKIQGASGGRKAKLRTALMSSKSSYAEFLVRFHGGKCMHTVPYKRRQTTGHVTKSEFNKLGTPRSAGCVRMPWKMAHYIYVNCPVGTPVKVYKGVKGKFPMGKPKKYVATTDVDPTYKR